MSAVHRLHRDRASTPLLETLPPSIARLCAKAEVSEDHLIGAVVWLLLGAVLVLLAFVRLGVWVALLLSVGLVAVPLAFALHWSGRRAARLIDDLPSLMDTIARSLRSGASFAQSLREARDEARGGLATELHYLTDDIERGGNASQALRAWADRAGSPEVRVVAAALGLASENEAGTTRALEGVSQSLRDRAALTGEIQALTAQASASLRALVLLPIAFVLLDALSTQAVLGYLIGERFGNYCLAAGIGLEVIGWLWMRALVRRQMPS